MRVILLLSLLLSGCFPSTYCVPHGAGGAVVAGAGLATMLIGIAAEQAERDAAAGQARSEAFTTSVRDVSVRGRWACPSGRQFRVVCVLTAAGRSCFYETDDRQTFDCLDEACVQIPRGVDEWCASAAPLR
jgi:hypothetical protein